MFKAARCLQHPGSPQAGFLHFQGWHPQTQISSSPASCGSRGALAQDFLPGVDWCQKNSRKGGGLLFWASPRLNRQALHPQVIGACGVQARGEEFTILPVLFSHWVPAHQHHLTLSDKISTSSLCILWGFFFCFHLVPSFLKDV